MAVAAMFTACQEEPLVPEFIQESAADYIASIEDFGTATKTLMTETNRVVWNAGDELMIFQGYTLGDRYKVSDASAGTSNGTFTIVKGEGGVKDGDYVAGTELSRNVAVYPYSEDLVIDNVLDEDTGKPIAYLLEGIEIPAVQYYQENSFANGAFPMVAVTVDKPDHRLKFNNAAGALKLKLKGIDKIKSIKVEGNNGEKLSGKASVTAWFEDGKKPTLEMVEDAGTSVILDCGEGVQLSLTEATSFVIALPPTEFTEGFTITITDTEGNVETKTAKAANTVKRSGILSMPEMALNKIVLDFPLMSSASLETEFSQVVLAMTTDGITCSDSHYDHYTSSLTGTGKVWRLAIHAEIDDAGNVYIPTGKYEASDEATDSFTWQETVSEWMMDDYWYWGTYVAEYQEGSFLGLKEFHEGVVTVTVEDGEYVIVYESDVVRYSYTGPIQGLVTKPQVIINETDGLTFTIIDDTNSNVTIDGNALSGVTLYYVEVKDADNNVVAIFDLVTEEGAGSVVGEYDVVTYPDEVGEAGIGFDLSSWGYGVGGSILTERTSGKNLCLREGSEISVTEENEVITIIVNGTADDWMDGYTAYEVSAKYVIAEQTHTETDEIVLSDFLFLQSGSGIVTVYLGQDSITSHGYGNFSGVGNYLKFDVYSADGVTLVPGIYTASEEGGVVGVDQFSIGYDPGDIYNMGYYFENWGTCYMTRHADGTETGVKIQDGVLTIEEEDGVCTIKLQSSAMNISFVGPIDYHNASITLSPYQLILAPSETAQLTYSLHSFIYSEDDLIWSSDNTSVATVDASGLVTAVAAGETFITVKAGNSLRASCNVIVNNVSTVVPTNRYVDEYDKDHGFGIVIGNVVWAPVNCGYHETDYPYGKLYQWGRKYGQGYSGGLYDANYNIVGEYSDATYPQGENLVAGPVDASIGQSPDNKDCFYINNYGDNWCTVTEDDTMWNAGTEESPVRNDDNDPCPDGWRVPTDSELGQLFTSVYTSVVNDNGQRGFLFSDPGVSQSTSVQLFLPAAGCRSSFGDAYERGAYGAYWSSKPGLFDGRVDGICFYGDVVYMLNSVQAVGLSVRCVQVIDEVAEL